MISIQKFIILNKAKNSVLQLDNGQVEYNTEFDAKTALRRVFGQNTSDYDVVKINKYVKSDQTVQKGKKIDEFLNS